MACHYLTQCIVVVWLYLSLGSAVTFAFNEWPNNYNLQDGDSFDFIVIGAGSGGGAVSARLSEILNWRVLLLDAGGDPPVTSVIPSLFIALPNSEYDWKYHAFLDKGTGEAHPNRTLYLTRGKMLGGSSSINYELYFRGVPKDYDDWSKIAPGWDWNSTLYYFKKLEGMTDSKVITNPYTSQLHSTEGPVKISRPDTNIYFDEVNNEVLNSYEEIGIKRVIESNGPDIIGASRPHFTFHDGRRSSTAEAYLRPSGKRSNFYISKQSRVTKLLIDSDQKRVYGVKVKINNKKIINVYAKKEIILSAGAIDTPKILMLSGIGPKEKLEKLDINLVADLPVGKNLQDHAYIPLVFTGRKGFGSTLKTIFTVKELFSYPVPVQCSLFSLNESVVTESKKPQFQTINLRVGAALPVILPCKYILHFDDDFCEDLAKTNFGSEIDFTFFVLLHPLSRGEVTLSSKDPLDDPVIDMGYFRNTHDLDVIVKGIQFIKRLTSTSHYKKYNGKLAQLAVKECKDFKADSSAYWRCYAKHTVNTLYHPAGTCAMGNDGVVDERLRVHGVLGLRIVDASVIPIIPSGNINTPTMMIGEKAADMIKYDHNFQPDN